jgi:hypothetical protein
LEEFYFNRFEAMEKYQSPSLWSIYSEYESDKGIFVFVLPSIESTITKSNFVIPAKYLIIGINGWTEEIKSEICNSSNKDFCERKLEPF